MSALWRINLWVTAFFAVVTLACAGLLLHQAVADVERELQSAEAVVEYLSDSAERNPAGLQPHLTQSLRHVRVHWLGPDEAARMPEEAGLDAWLGRQLFSDRRHSARELDLGDGRRVLIAVDSRDEIDEVWDSLQQLLSLCGLALFLSLLTIRWAVRRGMGLLDDLLRALQQVSGGQLAVRLREAGLPEARQLAGHFNRMTATLEQTRADNAQLTQALLAVQERERTYLAQTLHDDLGQYLAGIRAQVCLLRMVSGQPTVVEHTAQALELNCERLQQGFRALVQDLYPVVLQHLPLAEAFGLLVSQWQDSQGIDCQLRVGADLPALPSASKTHLYRLLQEALTNVARHADASQVRVRLQRSAQGLRLLVRDNGCGARQPLRPGVGLHSMAERARSLGGELHILSRPGAGWALALNMPLNMPMEA
ncbi:sensor histidine kinase [Pseudomonas protegens]|uniref:sensor histidine kinase n=1 Tax=Pseudomonas protegens TaxID=380021 RepID=UPI00044241FB|nr:sensor histidine kinase [Pseudomonas protegens]WRV93914.1 sensor histidine kinase [Pseudomonas protegens]BAO61598.1 two-component sensor histidine kinase PedS2 [Pseudomonas protegens Cab57]